MAGPSNSFSSAVFRDRVPVRENPAPMTWSRRVRSVGTDGTPPMFNWVFPAATLIDANGSEGSSNYVIRFEQPGGSNCQDSAVIHKFISVQG